MKQKLNVCICLTLLAFLTSISASSQVWTPLKRQDSLSVSEKQRLVVLCYESMEYWYNEASYVREANGLLDKLVKLKDNEIMELSKENAELMRSNDILDKKVKKLRKVSIVSTSISVGIVTLLIVLASQ